MAFVVKFCVSAINALVFDVCCVVPGVAMVGVAPITLLPGAGVAFVVAAAAGVAFVVAAAAGVAAGFLFSPSAPSAPASSLFPMVLLYISPIPGNVNASLISDVPPINCCKGVFTDIFGINMYSMYNILIYYNILNIR